MSSTEKPFPFLSLPLEIRRMVYSHVLGPPRVLGINKTFSKLSDGQRELIYRDLADRQGEEFTEGLSKDALLLYKRTMCTRILFGRTTHRQFALHWEWRTGIVSVSKQVSREALDVLYQQHVFRVPACGCTPNYLIPVGAHNLARIRRIQLLLDRAMVDCINTTRDPTTSPGGFDPEVWQPLTEGLVQLCLVMWQPVQPRPSELPGLLHQGWTQDRIDEELRAALGRFLLAAECVVHFLSEGAPKTVEVCVDADGRAEGTELAEKYFGGRCRPVRTRWGDALYKRRSTAPARGREGTERPPIFWEYEEILRYDSERSDDEWSDEEGIDEGGDDEGSDEEGSDEEGSDEEGSDEEGSDEEGSDEEGSDEEGSDYAGSEGSLF